MDEKNKQLQTMEENKGKTQKSAFLPSLFFQWPREIRMRRTHRVNH